MMARTQITLDREVQKQARKRAAELGISFAEYIRRLVESDVGVPTRRVDPTVVFDLGGSGGSDIAHDKDRMIGEATVLGRRRNPDP